MRLTTRLALAAPAANTQKLIYDDGSPLGLRIMPSGTRTWFCEIWLRPSTTASRGRAVRRSIGSIRDFSCDAARSMAIKLAGELISGRDSLQIARVQKKKQKDGLLTVADSVREYAKGKRRAKDGLALKARTVNDYIKMVEVGGLLHQIAHRPIRELKSEEIHSVFLKLSSKSEHSAAAAMRTLRAVLNWYGIVIADSPFAKTTAGRKRITLRQVVGNPCPIEPEKLRLWWETAINMEGNAGADGCRFILLTGARPGEIFGSNFAPGLLVRDVDLKGSRVFLKDTKNRRDHTILLSRQALNIIAIHCEGKQPMDKVFNVLDPGKTLAKINRLAGVKEGVSPHKLRHTFASVAEELVSGYVLKRMINHSDTNDITGTHYIAKSESQLRVGWQTVADFIAPIRQDTDLSIRPISA